MSASRRNDRSTDDFGSWLRAGGDGARRPSRANHANAYSLRDIPRGPSLQMALANLRPRHELSRRATLWHGRRPPSAINRHSA